MNVINYVIHPECCFIDKYEGELFEMAACGYTEGMYLVIFTNDGGWVPHFHVFNNQNPKKTTVNACLKLETPEYFKHGNHTDILNAKQVKQLVKFLKSEMRPDMTWWQHLVDTWNSNNSKQELPYNLPMPDYTSLNM